MDTPVIVDTPVIAFNPTEGHRAPTDAELSEWQNAEQEAGFSPTMMIGATIVRRLSCSDPMDMRAIWYLAALALGAPEKDARRASLGAIYIDDRQDHILSWGLTCPRFHSFFDLGRRLPAYWWGNADTDEKATVALCVAVWGSK